MKKIKKRINQFFAFLYYKITFKKYNKNIITLKRDWIIYSYLKHKYNKYLYNLPKFESKEIYSNKVWWCWLQGEDNAPDLNKACLNSLRKELNDREIIVITNDNYNNYVEFPDYIIKKYEKGLLRRLIFLIY